MSLVDRYIFRQLLAAFVLVLTVLTMVVWLTTALRQLDLVTGQGQTFFIFFKVTALAVPMLMAHIAPFALFIASVFVLNKLSGDSELIVMSASGLSDTHLLRPFMALGLMALLAGWIMTLFIVPAALHDLRDYVTNARADLISTIIQPGKFTSIDKGLTFHVRDRSPGGALLGVFVNDRRDEELEMTYMGTKGLITKTPDGTFLILDKATTIRRPKGKEFGYVMFAERNVFNLSALVGGVAKSTFSPSELPTYELFHPETMSGVDDIYLSRARGELHNRFAVPLYSLAFMLIAFAALGKARTTRQSRNQSVVAAILAVVVLRVAGFGMTGLAQRFPAAVPLIYAVPLLGIFGALWFGPLAHKPLPSAILERLDRLVARTLPKAA